MRDTQIRLVPWGLILLLLPLVIFLPPLLRAPLKYPIPVLGKPVWEAKSQGTEGILGLRFSDSDDYLLSSCGGDVELWNVPSRRRERAMPVPATVYSVAFSRLGGRPSLLAGTNDSRLFEWTQTGTDPTVHRFKERDDFLTGLVPLGDTSIAILLGGDIGIVDPSWRIAQRPKGHCDRVKAIAPIGKDSLVSAGDDGKIELWRRVDGSWMIEYSIERGRGYTAVAAHEESRMIAAFGLRKGGHVAIDLFRVDGGLVLSGTIDELTRDIRDLAFTSDGKFLLGAAQTLNCCVGEVMIHELGKPGICKWFNAHTLPTLRIATAGNSDLFATGGADSMIRLWSLSEVLTREHQKEDVRK